jgi:hypothetical protein
MSILTHTDTGRRFEITERIQLDSQRRILTPLSIATLHDETNVELWWFQHDATGQVLFA